MKIASHVEGTKAAIYVDGITEGMTQEQLGEAIRQALSPVQDATGPWISVEDDLPIPGHFVLVKGDDDWGTGCIFLGRWTNSFDVTHWAEVRV